MLLSKGATAPWPRRGAADNFLPRRQFTKESLELEVGVAGRRVHAPSHGKQDQSALRRPARSSSRSRIASCSSSSSSSRPSSGPTLKRDTSVTSIDLPAHSPIRKIATSSIATASARGRRPSFQPGAWVPSRPNQRMDDLRFPIWRFSARTLDPDRVARTRGPVRLGVRPREDLAILESLAVLEWLAVLARLAVLDLLADLHYSPPLLSL